MKSVFKVSGVLIVVLFMSSAFGFKVNDSTVHEMKREGGIEITGQVKEIIEAKCMGCHKPDARNEKAREKLQWVKVPDMNEEEQKHLVAEMFEVLEDGKMPPKRTVERRPQMKLTDKETQVLLAWVEKEDKRLRGK